MDTGRMVTVGNIDAGYSTKECARTRPVGGKVPAEA